MIADRTRKLLRRLKGHLTAFALFFLSPSFRDHRRRERFLAKAARYTVALVVDGPSGRQYFVDSRDAVIGRELFLTGHFDAAHFTGVLEVLADRGMSPLQILDIGANVGTTSIELLDQLPDARALAFEPDPTNVRLLRHNVLANELTDRMVVHHAAISDHDGPVTLELAPANFGDHRVRADGPIPRGEMGEEDRATTTVTAWRVDTLVARDIVSLDLPSLMWIDVQGHEGRVLAGAMQCQHMPVVVEFWPYALQRAKSYELFVRLAGSYSQIFDLRGGMHEVGDLQRLGTQLGERQAFTDLLLLPVQR